MTHLPGVVTGEGQYSALLCRCGAGSVWLCHDHLELQGTLASLLLQS